MPGQNEIKIFAGNSNPILVEKICVTLGIEKGKAFVGKFKDGEIRLEINENVRGKRVWVIQGGTRPVHQHLMELLIMIDALKRASAKEITAVVPYYPYARQDRKVAPRAPISSKLVADLLTTAGITRLITVDLHAGQIQGFFDVPVDNLFAQPVFLKYIREYFSAFSVIVAPDAGAVERAASYAKKLKVEMAIIDKRRDAPNQAEAFNVVGSVKDKDAIIIDDLVDTANTLRKGAALLHNEGAKNIFAFCTHGVLSGDAVENIDKSVISKLFVTDTYPLTPQALTCKKIEIISIAELIAQAIKRDFLGESVSDLFKET